jgi:hypothetical protein
MRKVRNNGKETHGEQNRRGKRSGVLTSSQVISRVPSLGCCRLYLGRSVENILEPVRRVSGPAAGTRTKCAKIAPRAADVVRSASSNTRVHRTSRKVLRKSLNWQTDMTRGALVLQAVSLQAQLTRERRFELRNMTAGLFRPQTRAASQENLTQCYMNLWHLMPLELQNSRHLGAREARTETAASLTLNTTLHVSRAPS